MPGPRAFPSFTVPDGWSQTVHHAVDSARRAQAAREEAIIERAMNLDHAGCRSFGLDEGPTAVITIHEWPPKRLLKRACYCGAERR